MIIYAGLGFYFFKTLFESNDQATSYVNFISGFDLVLILFLFQFTYVRWHSVMIAVSLLMIALIINAWAENSSVFSTSQGIEITFRLLVAAVYTTVFSYVSDRNWREIYKEKSELKDNESIHKEILNQVPESILILGAELQEKYHNDCFERLVSQTGESIENLNLDAFFGKFKDLSKVVVSSSRGRYDFPASIGTNELKPLLMRFVRKMEEGSWDTNEGLSTFTNQGLDPKQNITLVYRGTYKKMTPVMQNLTTTAGDEDEPETNTERTVEIKLLPIKYQGEFAVLMIIRHAPEIKLLEQLKKASKYKDEILASVSHELRTPINSNMNLINEALKSPDVPQRVKENLLDPAFKSGKLLLNLVNDILDTSQIKEGKLKLVSQVCEIRKVIQECHYLFEHQCRQKKIALNLTIDKRIPLKIRTDPNRLTQIVLNLLSNAYKFTLEGSITIQMTLENGGLIKVSVVDTGIGIKEEDMGKLMKKFEKIDLGENQKFNSTGAGLGLTIANSLAIMLGPKDSHLGGLKFSSEWGKGTTASFLIKSRKKFNPNANNVQTHRFESPIAKYLKDFNASSDCIKQSTAYEEEDSSGFLEEENALPLVYAFSKKDTRLNGALSIDWQRSDSSEKTLELETKPILNNRRAHVSDISCGCPRVLVVDDDAFNVLTMQTLLNAMQVTSETAHSGIECIKTIQSAEKCCKRCRRFTLVLLDGNMPMKDGFTTARELVEWNTGLGAPWKMNIVGCTAYTEKTKWKEFLDAGAIEHVTKPLNKADLERILKKCQII